MVTFALIGICILVAPAVVWAAGMAAFLLLCLVGFVVLVSFVSPGVLIGLLIGFPLAVKVHLWYQDRGLRQQQRLQALADQRLHAFLLEVKQSLRRNRAVTDPS